MTRLASIAVLSLAACGGRAPVPPAPAAVAQPIGFEAVDELDEAFRSGAVARYYDGEAGVDVVDFLAAAYEDEPGPLGQHLCGSHGAAYVAGVAEEVQREIGWPPPDDAAWSCTVEGIAASEVHCGIDTHGEFTPNVELYLTGTPLRLTHIILTPNGVLGHDWGVEAADVIKRLSADGQTCGEGRQGRGAGRSSR